MKLYGEVNQTLINEISEILVSFLEDDTVNMLKLSESFAYSYYTTTNYSKTSRVMNFQISDENFLFSVNINKDDQGNITLFNIKKESSMI